MPDVFISYARKHKEFVTRLHGALANLNRDVWVDWEDIPLTANWWQEIQRGIDGADTFAFVITPESVQSKVCRQEIEYAVASNKRFVPILREKPSDDLVEQMHYAIHSHNWIYFQESDDFDVSFNALIKTLDTDLGYVRRHTRLLVRAREWELNDHNASYLLQGDDLRSAETWLVDSVEKEPKIADLHREYIVAGRQAEDERFQQTALLEQRAKEAQEQAAILEKQTVEYKTQTIILEKQAVESKAQTEILEKRTTASQKQAKRSRWTAIIAGVVGVLAMVATVFAASQTSQALTQVANAGQTLTPIQGTLVSGQTLAAQAQNDAATATFGLGTAQFQAQRADNLALTADAAQGTSAYQATQAGIAQQIAQQDAQNAQTQAAVAGTEQIDAQNQAATAQAQAGTAIGLVGTATVQQGEAQQQAYAAGTAQAEAQVQATNAIELASTATYSLGTALAQAAEANVAASTNQAIAATAQAAVATATYSLGTAQAQAAEANIAVATSQALVGTVQAEIAIATVQLGQVVVANQTAQANAALSSSQRLSLALVEASRQLLANGDPDMALALALQADQADSQSWESHRAMLNAAYTAGTRRIFGAASIADNVTQTGMITGLAFSPDGRYVISGSTDNSLTLWDTETGQAVRRFTGHGGPIKAVDFAPNGQTVISASDDGTLILWDVNSGEKLTTYTNIYGGRPTGVAFRRDGLTIVTSWTDKRVIPFDVATGSARDFQEINTTPLDFLALSPAGDQGEVLLASETGLRIWNTNTERDHVLEGSGGVGVFTPDGKTVLVSAKTENNPYSNILILRDTETRAEKGRLIGHSGEITSVDVSPDGNLAVSGSSDGIIILWDIRERIEIARLRGHGAVAVRSIAFSANGQYIVSGDDNGQIRLWETEPRGENGHFEATLKDITILATTNDSRLMLMVDADFNIVLWDAQTGTSQPINLSDEIDEINTAAFSPDAKQIVFGEVNGALVVWDVASRLVVFRSTDFDQPTYAAYSPDGQTLFSGSGGTLRLWNAATREVIRDWTSDAGSVTTVAFSSDGHLLLSVHTGGMIVWDSSTYQQTARTDFTTYNIHHAAFAVDDKSVLASSESQLLRWPFDAGVTPFVNGDGESHTAPVTGISFSPDGSVVVTSGLDGSVRLWDYASGRLLYNYKLFLYGEKRTAAGHAGGVIFNSDGMSFTAAYGNIVAFYRVGSRATLKNWIQANRYVIPISCADREQYGLKRCKNGVFPTSTPGGPESTPTLTPIPAVSSTLTPSLELNAIATPTTVAVRRSQIVSDDPTVVNINVREFAGAGYAIVGKTRPGVFVDVLDEISNAMWAQIRLDDGTVGWVMQAVIKDD